MAGRIWLDVLLSSPALWHASTGTVPVMIPSRFPVSLSSHRASVQGSVQVERACVPGQPAWLGPDSWCDNPSGAMKGARHDRSQSKGARHDRSQSKELGMMVVRSIV